MSVRTLDPGPQPLVSTPSHAAVLCPDCGGARRITTDGFSGLTREECDGCDRKAARAQLRAQFDVAALARVAERFGITVDVAIARLSNTKIVTVKPPKPMPACWICSATVPKWGATKETTRCAEHKPGAMRAAAARAAKLAKKQAKQEKKDLRERARLEAIAAARRLRDEARAQRRREKADAENARKAERLDAKQRHEEARRQTAAAAKARRAQHFGPDGDPHCVDCGSVYVQPMCTGRPTMRCANCRKPSRAKVAA